MHWRRFVAGLLLIGLFCAVVAVGAGYRLMSVTSGGESRLAVVSPQPGSALTRSDLVVLNDAEGTVGTYRVTEIEMSENGSLLATVAETGGTPGQRLHVLDLEELVVRHTIASEVVDGARFVVRLAAVVATLAVLVLTVQVLRALWGTAEFPPIIAGLGQMGRSSVHRLQSATGVIVIIALLGGGIAGALFTSTDSAINNQFGTGCFDASVAGVQTGETTNSAEGTEIVTISSVDPARSVVFTSLRSNSTEPADSMVLANLASATQLELVRRTDAGSVPPIVVRWTVVEYDCGVTVQRGTTAGNGTATVDVTIAPVDLTTSFVLTTSVTDRADSAHDGDDDHLAALDDPSTLRLTAPTGSALPTNHSYGWQVVSFDDPGDLQVQTGTTTLSGANSDTITLATAVDPRTTLVVAHAASDGSGADIGSRMARVHLSSSTTVEVTRLLGGDTLELSVQVITFAEGTTVQQGIVNLPGGQASTTVAVNPLDTSRAMALSTVASPGSLSGGATDTSSGAVLGDASATFELSDPSTVAITRSATVGAASFGWQAVEWGGPQWWDVGYPFRQRMDVATSTVAAPDAYTVAITFDHQALVSAGLARADGDDVRVLRWDGSSWSELDRVLDDGAAWDDSATTLRFRTTSAIGVTTSDSYWLYYGNDAPAAPAADPEGVWLLHEDFESGTLGDFEDRTAATGWYQADPWTARIPLSIPSILVDADLSEFPVYVELTDAGLASGAKADGSDIRFAAADGTTALAHEIESWDSATGALSAWVSLPTVSSSSATNFYLLYGAANAPDQQDASAVWGEGNAIWHLNRDPSGPAPQIDDSSSARRDGLSSGAMTTGDLVAGRVGSAIDFDGSDDRLDVEPFDLSTKTLTVSGWVRLDSVVGDQLVIGKATDAVDRIITLGTTGSQARFELKVDGVVQSLTGGTLSTGTWHHLAGTWDGATMRLLVDGYQVQATAVSGNLDREPSMAVTVGDTASNEQPLNGLADEARIESAVRSNARLLTTFRNQNNPATFVAAGASEAGSWFGQGIWLYRKPLAVDASVVDATLTDQPVLVALVDAEMAGKAQTDGDDIVFTAADGVTRLDHELEEIDAATGTVTAWVRVPSLDATANTELFVYYGNASAVDQTDPEAVFGDTADLVFHGS